MKCFGVGFFNFIFITTAFAADDWSKHFPVGVSKPSWGVVLGEDQPYRLNDEKEMVPASVSKIFTAQAALATLGQDFRFETQVTYKESPTEPGVAYELSIIGAGDPSWGAKVYGETFTTRLDSFAKSLRDIGIKKIKGPILFKSADPRWDGLKPAEGWQPMDLVYCYGTLPEVFNLNFNCEVFKVQSAKSGVWSNPYITTPVSVQLTETTTEATALALVRGKNGFIIQGKLKKGETPLIEIPIRSVSGWMSGLLRASLKTKGLKVDPAVVITPTNAQPRSISYFSPNLREIIRPFLKSSINMIGEILVLKMGEQKGRSDLSLYEAGREVFREHVYQFMGSGGYAPYDGSGLSRLNSVRPAFVKDFLDRLQNNVQFVNILKALPIAGIDGTLGSRMIGTSAQGRLMAKTGTMSTQSNLAGYVPLKIEKGEAIGWKSFVLFGYSKVGAVVSMRATQNNVGAQMSAHLGKVTSFRAVGIRAVPETRNTEDEMSHSNFDEPPAQEIDNEPQSSIRHYEYQDHTGNSDEIRTMTYPSYW